MSSENNGREELPGDYWIFEQLGSPVKTQHNQKPNYSATEVIRKLSSGQIPKAISGRVRASLWESSLSQFDDFGHMGRMEASNERKSPGSSLCSFVGMVYLCTSQRFLFDQEQDYENAFRHKLGIYAKNMRSLIVTARKQINDLKQENTILKHKLLSSGLTECPACLYRFKPESKHRILPKYVKVFRGRLSLEIEFSSLDEMTKWLTLNQLDENTDGLPTMVDCGEEKLDLATTGSTLHQLVKEMGEKGVKAERLVISTRPRPSHSGASSSKTPPRAPAYKSGICVAADKEKLVGARIASPKGGCNDESEAYQKDHRSSSSTRASCLYRNISKGVEGSSGCKYQPGVNDVAVESTSVHNSVERQSSTSNEPCREAHKENVSAEWSIRLETMKSSERRTRRFGDNNKPDLGGREQWSSSRFPEKQGSLSSQILPLEEQNKNEADEKAKDRINRDAREHSTRRSREKGNFAGRDAGSADECSSGTHRASSRSTNQKFAQKEEPSLPTGSGAAAHQHNVHRRQIKSDEGRSGGLKHCDGPGTRERTANISNSYTSNAPCNSCEDKYDRCHRKLEKPIEQVSNDKTNHVTPRKRRKRNRLSRKRKSNGRNRSHSDCSSNYSCNRHHETRGSPYHERERSPSSKRRRISITSEEEAELVDSDDELVIIDEEEVEDGEIVD